MTSRQAAIDAAINANPGLFAGDVDLYGAVLDAAAEAGHIHFDDALAKPSKSDQRVSASTQLDIIRYQKMKRHEAEYECGHLRHEVDHLRGALTRIIEDEVGGRCPMGWILPDVVIDADQVRDEALATLQAVLRVAYEALGRDCPLDRASARG